MSDYGAIDPWHLGAYVDAIRPSTYDPVIESCYGLEGKLMVCNPNSYHSCPPVYICIEAVHHHIDPDYLRVQTGHIRSYASIPIGQPREVLPDVAALLAKWGLAVIRQDRWLMNSDEVTFEAIVHFLDLCRPVWQG